MPRHSLQAHLQVPEVGEVAYALRYGALEVVIAKVSAHFMTRTNAGHCMRVNQGPGTRASAINPMVAAWRPTGEEDFLWWLAGWLDVLASYWRRLPQAINSHNHDMLTSIVPFSPLFGWMSKAMTRQMLSIGPWMLWWWTRSSQGTVDLYSLSTQRWRQLEQSKRSSHTMPVLCPAMKALFSHPLPLKLWGHWGNGSKSFFMTVPRAGGITCGVARTT